MDTAAASDQRAARADQLQYELGEGPCLDAIWAQDTVQIEDMTTEQRYPAWARRVVKQTSIRSSLSLPLFTTEDSLGALNLYAPQPEAFDAEIRGEGLAFAAQAAVALRCAQTEQHLRAAMVSRNLIGQAQGILMERFKMTAEQAFAALSRISQQSNVKLRDVAQRLIDTGEPPPGRSSGGHGRAARRHAVWTAGPGLRGLPATRAHRDPALPEVIGLTPVAAVRNPDPRFTCHTRRDMHPSTSRPDSDSDSDRPGCASRIVPPMPAWPRDARTSSAWG